MCSVALVLLFLILPSLLVIPLSFSDSRYLGVPAARLVDALV